MSNVNVVALIVAASFGINYQFANWRTVLWLIDGGYHSVQFTIYGLILGLWRQGATMSRSKPRAERST
jgi:hypothetical protein